MYKSEIESRLNKADYTRLPRVLGMATSYENTNASNDLKSILRIADANGIKYLQFYKLMSSANIEDFLSNFTTIPYNPNMPHTDGDDSISISEVSLGNTEFNLLANFYRTQATWVVTAERTKSLQDVLYRRVIHLKYYHANNILVLSIDPVGDGAKIEDDISEYLREIFTPYSIDFNLFFGLLDISGSIYSMIDQNILKPTRLSSIDEVSQRTYDANAQNPNDSLTDEALFVNTKNRDLDILRMKLKHSAFKLNIELFTTDLVRIWAKANWEQSDAIEADIIRFLP